VGQAVRRLDVRKLHRFLRAEGSRVEIAAGIGAERSVSETGIRGYGPRYDELAVGYPLVPRAIATPHGAAVQGLSETALAARSQVQQGATLYRVGTTGRSGAAEAQFWALEHPSTPGFASQYGIPPANIQNLNFIEAGTLRPGTPFVTRQAPPVGSNLGGGIEIVVPEGRVLGLL
jgi:hypothetical protein